MLDTVRLVLPDVSLPIGMDDEKWEVVGTTAKGVYFERWRLRVGRLKPALRHLHVHHGAVDRNLVIEGSLPRLAHGNNVVPLREDELPKVVDLLDQLVRWAYSDFNGYSLLALPSVATWKVRRADLCFDYLPKVTTHAAALAGLLSLQPSRRMRAHRIDHETVYFHGRGKRRRYTLTIYDKAAEVKAKHPALAAEAAGRIRIEVRLQEQGTIKQALGLAAAPTLVDIADRSRISQVLLRKLSALRVRPGAESVLTGREELVTRVGPRAARRLWPFAQARASMPVREIAERWGLSMETCRRYERELRKAGLYPATVAVKGVMEDLVEQIQAFGAAQVPVATTTNPSASASA